MIADGKAPKNCCLTVYMKPSPNKVPGEFFKVAHDSDLDSTFYTARYRANVKEAHMKKKVNLYHPDAKYLYLLDTDDTKSSGKENYVLNSFFLYLLNYCFCYYITCPYSFSNNDGKQRIY